MSLQVWLPLNGKINNNGLLSTSFTTSNVTMNSNDAGFNGADNISYMILNPGLPTDFTTFTFCAWIYKNSTTQDKYHTIYTQRTKTGAGVSIFLYPGDQNKFRFDVGSSNHWTPNYTLTNEVWTHICFIFDGAKKYLYINGQLKETDSSSSSFNDIGTIGIIGAADNSGDGTPRTHYLDARLKDVRIYDECISPKTIKEISKGLFLHYKMDNTDYYDCSGFDNNGTNIGDLELTEKDTIRYSNCTVYDGTTSQYIQVPDISPETFTISFWFKRTADTGTRQFFYSGWYGVGCELADNGKPLFRVRGDNTNYDVYGSAILVANGWTHYAGVVENGVGSKLYINGKLVSSKSFTDSVTWGLAVNNWIGRYKNVESYLSAQMSDFRMYFTALSESDIKELYNTSAVIDNEGNLYVREDVEVDSGAVKVNKAGVFNNTGLTEDKATASFYKTGAVDCNNIIEF